MRNVRRLVGKRFHLQDGITLGVLVNAVTNEYFSIKFHFLTGSDNVDILFIKNRYTSQGDGPPNRIQLPCKIGIDMNGNRAVPLLANFFNELVSKF